MIDRGREINHWEMPSSSRPDVKYHTKEWESGELTCDCPAWCNAKKANNGVRRCPHIEAIKVARSLSTGLSGGQTLVTPMAKAGRKIRL